MINKIGNTNTLYHFFLRLIIFYSIDEIIRRMVVNGRRTWIKKDKWTLTINIDR